MRRSLFIQETGLHMQGYVDCHCHISAGDFDKVLLSFHRGNSCLNLLNMLRVLLQMTSFSPFCFRFSGFVFPCLGVHPVQEVPPHQQRVFIVSVLQDLDAAIPVIEKYKDELVAIGEVGLDFTPRFVSSESDKENQRQVLIRQAQIAKELDLPLEVSCSSSTLSLGVEKALLHAFDGKPSVAMEGVKAGYFFSIPPSIIRSEQKQKLVKQLPLENICLETDSPALGPEKQVRNEPINIRISAEYISTIKGVSLETVMEVTTQNALRLFPKLKSLVVAKGLAGSSKRTSW
uniref:TatD DNase domain containing 3 n=1 Tax=Kryptolebias marmoratus TaxID=37003 RepID=A0A3Q3GCY2_KRYMA